MATSDHHHLVEQRSQLLRELADIGDLRQGSLRTQYRKCGARLGGKPMRTAHMRRDGGRTHEHGHDMVSPVGDRAGKVRAARFVAAPPCLQDFCVADTADAS